LSGTMRHFKQRSHCNHVQIISLSRSFSSSSSSAETGSRGRFARDWRTGRPAATENFVHSVSSTHPSLVTLQRAITGMVLPPLPGDRPTARVPLSLGVTAISELASCGGPHRRKSTRFTRNRNRTSACEPRTEMLAKMRGPKRLALPFPESAPSTSRCRRTTFTEAELFETGSQASPSRFRFFGDESESLYRAMATVLVRASETARALRSVASRSSIARLFSRCPRAE